MESSKEPKELIRMLAGTLFPKCRAEFVEDDLALEA